MKAAQRRAELEREAAERAEALAEEQAPRQQRISGKAEPDRKRGGFRRVDPLRAMHAQDKTLVTASHLRAATRFSVSYEIGVLGATGARTVEWVDGGDGQMIPDRQLNAIRDYRAACDALGSSLRVPVQLTALHRWTLSAVARVLGVTTQRASGYLVAGLDRLVEHYDPQQATRCTMPMEMLVVDATVLDVPQERLGRARERKVSADEAREMAAGASL